MWVSYRSVITSSPGTAVDDALRAAVGHGVGGEGRWPHEPLEPDEFDRLLVTAMSERLLGVLAEAVADGALSLPSEQLEQLTHLHAGSQAHMLEIERLLLRVIERFGELGIEYRVLKGVALAHLVYADPAWRVAADVDLLVRGDRLADAIRIAVDEFGGDQLVPELRPGFDREFGKESMVRVGNVELDLHRTFVVGPFGLTIELADLFTEANTITVGERRLIALGTEHLFLHACYNVALGDYPVRWGSVHDLLLCAKHLPIDLDRAIAIAQRWQGTAVVRRAAEVAVDMGRRGRRIRFPPARRHGSAAATGVVAAQLSHAGSQLQPPTDVSGGDLRHPCPSPLRAGDRRSECHLPTKPRLDRACPSSTSNHAVVTP